MNAITPAELLTVAGSLFPGKISSDSKSEQLDALQKTMRLLEIAQEFLENPDASVYKLMADSDEVLPYNHPEILKLAKIIPTDVDEPYELAKRAYQKAETRFNSNPDVLHPLPSIKEGITRGHARTIFEIEMKTGPKPKNMAKLTEVTCDPSMVKLVETGQSLPQNTLSPVMSLPVSSKP